mgnify:FL=1
MRSRGFEKVTVDRILTQPPVHIDGKGLRAYRSFELMAAKVSKDEGFSMRATARDFDAGLTLARVDKPLKEEAVGC